MYTYIYVYIYIYIYYVYIYIYVQAVLVASLAYLDLFVWLLMSLVSRHMAVLLHLKTRDVDRSPLEHLSEGRLEFIATSERREVQLEQI